MVKEVWTTESLPDLSGRSIVITGANSGLGFEAALALARRGADLTLACRRLEPAREAGAAIRRQVPGAAIEVMELDLANLASIRSFSEKFRARGAPLHVLCNNAGVMALPLRRTVDGFEMQLGTNHLGHFALTGLLLERLLATPRARVVHVSSTAHRLGRIHFDDLQWERRYSRWSAYAQSKLANLLFTYEFQRRCDAAGYPLISVACHPGYASTGLQFAGPRMQGSRWNERVMSLGNRIFAQSAAMGTLPVLYAAVEPKVRGADYIGPRGFAEMYGYPGLVRSSRRSQDPAVARRLWEVSEDLTGGRFLSG